MWVSMDYGTNYVGSEILCFISYPNLFFYERPPPIPRLLFFDPLLTYIYIYIYIYTYIVLSSYIGSETDTDL